jgi:hypothetical protein
LKEANIIAKFRDKLPGHWTSIENSVTSGVPDYVASRNGVMCWIEFKRLYNRDIIVRPLQRNWFARERRHNLNACLAWWDDGPVICMVDEFTTAKPKEKGGKLYYDTDQLIVVSGWMEIDNQLFG